MTSDPPILVRNDPWLTPYQGAIGQRSERFDEALAALGPGAGALAAYANGHKFMGIHLNAMAGQWTVREWAPAARAVSLIGDFNGWNRESHPLSAADNGIWQLHLPAASLDHGQQVKLHVAGADGSRRDRIPACIRRAVQDPNSHDYAGQIWQPPQPFKWQHTFDPASLGSPLIYEAHVGMAGEEPRVHTYREFAEAILPRIARAGYNTVQLMAVQEHPYYGSFGYHVSSFFAPCSRFGTPEDLKYLLEL